MIQVTPQMKILVAVEPADFRKGIDSLSCLCRTELDSDPLSGKMFVFRNRRKTSIKILVYDSQGFWLFQKRMSTGRFRWWPTCAANKVATNLEAHELQLLIFGGDPNTAKAAPAWRRVNEGR